MKLIPHRLTGSFSDSILSLPRLGTALAARGETVLYPYRTSTTAAPQHISGRTS
jgi:hypothetical protein